MGCPKLDSSNLANALSHARDWERELRCVRSPVIGAALDVLEVAAAIVSGDGDVLLNAIVLGERHAGLEVALSSLPEKWARNEMRERKAGRMGAAASHKVAEAWLGQAECRMREVVFAGTDTKVEPVLRKVREAMLVLEQSNPGKSEHPRPPGIRAMRTQLELKIKQAIRERDEPILTSPRRRRRRYS
jgi:hypothetical protein